VRGCLQGCNSGGTKAKSPFRLAKYLSSLAALYPYAYRESFKPQYCYICI
jgi:hypothetical protein